MESTNFNINDPLRTIMISADAEADVISYPRIMKVSEEVFHNIKIKDPCTIYHVLSSNGNTKVYLGDKEAVNTALDNSYYMSVTMPNADNKRKATKIIYNICRSDDTGICIIKSYDNPYDAINELIALNSTIGYPNIDRQTRSTHIRQIMIGMLSSDISIVSAIGGIMIEFGIPYDNPEYQAALRVMHPIDVFVNNFDRLDIKSDLAKKLYLIQCNCKNLINVYLELFIDIFNTLLKNNFYLKERVANIDPSAISYKRFILEIEHLFSKYQKSC